MIKRMIITSLLAITLCTGVGSAQTKIKVYICPAEPTASRQATVELRRTSTASPMPTLDVIAGQPIKVQVGPSNTNSYFTNDYSLTVSQMKTTPIACDDGDSFSPKRAFRGGTTVLTGAGLQTEQSWKGTCRLISVKLRNGAEFQGRIRFQ